MVGHNNYKAHFQTGCVIGSRIKVSYGQDKFQGSLKNIHDQVGASNHHVHVEEYLSGPEESSGVPAEGSGNCLDEYAHQVNSLLVVVRYGFRYHPDSFTLG